jgi:fucose permease
VPARRDAMLWGGVLLVAVMVALLPLQRHLALFALCSVVHAAANGFMDNLAQVLVLALPDVPADPVMQALHCGYGVGSLLAPWIASFYLPDHALPGDAADALGGGGGPPVPAADDPAYTRFHAAFFIVAALAVPSLAAQAWLLASATSGAAAGPQYKAVASAESPGDEPSSPPPPPSSPGSSASAAAAAAAATTGASESAPVEPVSAAPASGRTLVVLVALFLFLYVGCETGWGSYLATYANRQLGITPRDASLLTSAYWLSFAGARFAGIFISIRVAAGTMLMWSLGLSIAALTLILGSLSSARLLWVGSLVYGAGTATIFPSTITWLQKTAKVDGKTLSYVITAACIGDALIPFFQGVTLGTRHPSVFVFVAFLFLLLASVCYLVARHLTAARVHG